MMLRARHPDALLLLVDLPLFLSATVSVLTFYLMSQVAGGPALAPGDPLPAGADGRSASASRSTTRGR